MPSAAEGRVYHAGRTRGGGGIRGVGGRPLVAEGTQDGRGVGDGGVREGVRPSVPEGRVYHAGWTRGGGWGG